MCASMNELVLVSLPYWHAMPHCNDVLFFGDAATIQSFNRTPSIMDSASAMSLSAAPQSSVKLSLATVVGLRSIASNVAWSINADFF